MSTATINQEAQSRKGLLKAMGLMSVLTLISRVFGLVREIVRAHYLGTGAASDAFSVAFMLPNLFRRLVGEGSMTAAAVPTFIDEMKKGGTARMSEVASRFFTFFTFLLTGFCLLYTIFAGPLVEHLFARGFAEQPEKLALTVELSRYLFFYLLFISLAAVLQAVLNSQRVFGPSAFTPILLNVCIVGSAIGLQSLFELPVYAFVLGILLGGFVQLVFQYPYVRKLGISLRPSFAWNDPAVKRILKLMVPGILGAGVYQINVVLSQMIATYLVPGAVSSLQYSSRLEEFTLGVFIVAIGTAILPTFSALYSDGKIEELKRTLDFALRLVAFVTIPATVGLILIRYPLIALLFRTGEFDAKSIELTAFAFQFHASGLLFVGLARVLVSVFYSTKDLVTPVKTGAISVGVDLLTCLALAIPLQQGGVAFGNSMGALAQTLALTYFLRGRLGALPLVSLAKSFGKIALASAVMGAVAYGLLALLSLSPEASRLTLVWGLAVVIFGAALTFMAMARLLRLSEYAEAKRLFLGRLKRRG